MTTKQNIYEEHKKEYWQSDKRGKGTILNHVSGTTRLHRTSVIRKFRRLQTRDPARTERRGRETYYTKDVDAALFDVWEAANELCGELLHPLIREYVAVLLRDKMWDHGDEATAKLCAMGEHTARRRVVGFKKAHGTGKGSKYYEPKLLLIRTSSSPEKQCASPKATLRIRLEKWGEISGRRFAPPTIRSLKNR